MTIYFLEIVFESQSRPSYMPSPVVAHVAWMYHVRERSLWSASLSATSAAGMACGKSCLFANTRRTASRSSSSESIRFSSSRASSENQSVRTCLRKERGLFLTNTIAIITVHHKNDTLCVCVVMPPQWTDLSRGQHKETAAEPTGPRAISISISISIFMQSNSIRVNRVSVM